MSTTENNKPFIRGIAPPTDHEIVITVSDRCFSEGRKFKEKYLSGHPSCDNYTEGQLDLLGTAFLSVAGHLPIFSYDLIRWTDDTPMFDGGAAVREYAERKFGMTRA